MSMEEAIDAYLPTDHHSSLYRGKHNWYHLYVASGDNMLMTRYFPLLQLELCTNVARLQLRNLTPPTRDIIFQPLVHYCIGQKHNYIVY